MKIFNVNFPIFAAVAIGLVAGANAATLVVPSELANANGNLSGSFQFNNQRVQEVYSQSLFTSLAAPAMEISEIRFRVDPFSPSFSSSVELELRLSTTSQNPDSLNIAFAANTGLDEIVALPRSTLTWQGNPGLSFDVVVPLPNHFVYMPSKGHLLMDITVFNLGAQAGNFDVQNISGDGLSILGGATGIPTGNNSSAGFVTSFTYQAVPEPSVLILLSLGLALTLKRRNHVAP
jgi:hypothetical protein